MKRFCGSMLLLCTLLLLAQTVRASDDLEIINETASQLENYDLQVWQQAADSVSEELRALWNGKSMREWMMSYATGDMATAYEGGWSMLKEMLLGALRANAAIITILFGTALLTGVIGLLFEGEQGLKELLSLICCGMAVSASATFFLHLSERAGETLKQISDFAQQAVPVLSAMLTATGNVASAGMLRPLMAFLSSSVILFFTDFILPAVTAAGLLCIAGSLSSKNELQKLAKMLKDLCKWAIGLVFTVYLGTLSLQGMSLSGADSVGLRTIKYTLDKSIPVIGGAVSGTLDTVRGCAMLVKNAAGAATVLLTLAYVLRPALEILAASFALKLCAALCAPVADGKIAKMIEDIGDLCAYILAAVLAAALMFMILAGMCMALGNR